MPDITIKNQCFGMEDEMTGITRAEAAKALGEYFGTRPRHTGGGYDKWTVTDPNGKEWSLMSDASIKLEEKVEMDMSLPLTVNTPSKWSLPS